MKNSRQVVTVTNRALTKHQDIHDQESFRKSGFLYSALQSLIQYCVVTAITCVIFFSKSFKVVIQPLSIRLIKPNFCLSRV